MNIKNKVIAGFLLMALLLLIISSTIIYNIPEKPPLIQGLLLPQAKTLEKFTILDHNNIPFSNKNLLGRWHLISYGYTNCPDICPTTLGVLANVDRRLNQLQQYEDLQILFYSIDHKRDTVARLAEYISFYNDEFTGLTYNDDMQESALAFESSFGMISKLTTVETTNKGESFESYTVSHGVLLYLLNPEGNLQAVLKPFKSRTGVLNFTDKQIVDDYLAIRSYLD